MGLLPSSQDVGTSHQAHAQSEGEFDRALVDRIVFGRWWIPDTYHLTIATVVFVFAINHWTDRLWPERPQLCDEKRASLNKPAASERSPLLESLEHKTRDRRHGRLRHVRLRVRAALTYQPPPLLLANRMLPNNAMTLLLAALLAVNLFYLNYYTGSTLAIWSACILDRAGLLFVANLPWLYLLAAKTQPLRLLTGDSYEGLNILHRRLGEWICALAVFHVAGFFAFWWYYAQHSLDTLVEWLLQRFVLVGIWAFACYELLWATSLASFRAWWYEGFLAGHVMLQAAGLALLFFHHPNARFDVLVALAVFLVDRLVYRTGLKSQTMRASVNVLPDGETMLLSADWPLSSGGPSVWRKVFGSDIQHGWKPLEHVFVSAPALGRSHALQAHPFTIASAAPEGNQQHAWLSLIIRARDGFTKSILSYARANAALNIRFDGPYGSQHAVHMIRQSDAAVLVAGGSGIAVAYPVIWSLLHHAQPHDRCKRVALIWIVREASHLSWLGMERLEELRELGFRLVLPEPTTKAGRPDVRRLVVDTIEDVASSGGARDGSVGVVVSAPDAMNREVNNACAGLAWRGRDVRVAVEKFGW